MTGEVVTSYRVHFRSEDALRTARARLNAEGFVVTDVTAGAARALDARLGTEEEDAAVKLQMALADIDHDPLIEFQVASLEFFGS